MDVPTWLNRFAVPRSYQQTALLVGIVLALMLRGLFIAVAVAAIHQFNWIFYVFGAFLVVVTLGTKDLLFAVDSIPAI